jgi:hypothetical protein
MTVVLSFSVEEWSAFWQGLLYLLLSFAVRSKGSRVAAAILLLASIAACFAGLASFRGATTPLRGMAIAFPEVALFFAFYAVWNAFRYHRLLSSHPAEGRRAQ